MSNKPISDLRRRMIEDMTVRSFSDNTKNNYIRHVEALAEFLGRSPDTVTGDDLRRFQLHQVEQGAQPSKLNSQASVCAFSSPSHSAVPISPTSWRARIIRANCRACSSPMTRPSPTFARTMVRRSGRLARALSNYAARSVC